MKKLYFLFVSFLVLGAVGCTTGFEGDDNNVVVGDGTTTLSLSIADPMTKVGLGDKDENGNYSVFWTENDQISVNGIASTGITIDSENPGAALFTFNSPDLEKPYKILYPASQNENVTFAATQNYYEGGFEPGTAPFYGYMEAGMNGKLGHLSGVLRFTLVGADDKTTLKSMVVRAESGAISGEFSVDFSNGKLTAVNASSSLNYSFGEGLKLTAEGKQFFLVLPCGEYGICSAELRTTDDRVMYVRFKTSGSSAIKAGVVREFSPVTFKAGAQCTLTPFGSEEDDLAIDEKAYATAPAIVDGDYLVINNENELMWLCYNGAVVNGTTYNKIRIGENINMGVFSLLSLPSIKLSAGDEIDGNNKSITGLNMAEDASSIFGNVNNLNIHDLTLTDCSVNTTLQTGAGILVGMVSEGLTVDNVTFNNCSVVAPRMIGLVAGHLEKGSFNISNVTANGGLVETSYVSGQSGIAGGLVGYIVNNATTKAATFTNCTVSTTVKSYMEADYYYYGKIVGLIPGNYGKDKICFVDCNGAEATLVPKYDQGKKIAETAVLSFCEAHRADFCQTTLTSATDNLLGGERYCRGEVYYEGNRFVPEWDGKRSVTMTTETIDEITVYYVYSAFDLAKAQGTSLDSTKKLVFKTDIDMGGHTFKPINYVRSLDGEGHSLYNVKVERTHDAANNRGAGFIVYASSTTTHQNLTIVGADVTCNHDSSLAMPAYGVTDDNGEGNAYAGVLVSRAYGTYTASNVHIKDSKVRGVCKVGGLIGSISSGTINLDGCSVDNTTIENYDPKVVNYYKMETTSSGMVIDGLQWWYTAGECGGLVGFVMATTATINNCSVTNCKINCTGQPNKDVIANVWSESAWTSGAYKSGESIKGNATTTIAGRHVNQFIGDIRSKRTETQQEEGTGEYTTTISNYTVSGNSYNGVSADSTNSYNHEYASGQYCPVVGCAYYTGVDVKILVNIHVSHCAGTLNFNANGGEITTLTEGIGSGNNLSWFGGNSKNVNIGIFSNNGTSYYPAAPTE